MELSEEGLGRVDRVVWIRLEAVDLDDRGKDSGRSRTRFWVEHGRDIGGGGDHERCRREEGK